MIFLCFSLADADDLVVDLLGGSGAAAGGVDVEDDGLDGGVVAELAELGVDLVGVGDDAVDVDDADLGAAEAVEEPESSPLSADGGPDHGGDEQRDDGEGAADDRDPEPGGAARAGGRRRRG